MPELASSELRDLATSSSAAHDQYACDAAWCILSVLAGCLCWEIRLCRWGTASTLSSEWKTRELRKAMMDQARGPVPKEKQACSAPCTAQEATAAHGQLCRCWGV